MPLGYGCIRIALRGTAIIVLSLWLGAGYADDRVHARVTGGVQAGERRLALVIGNNAYPATPLRNAVADADAIALALTNVGFSVTRLADVTFPRFERAVLDFASELQPNDIALFYFSGHGVQVDNENYLIPVDFAGVEADVKYKAYPASRIHDNLAKARVRLIILDACRNNPFGSSRRLTRGGLAPMEDLATTGTMIAFATGPGATADDNVPGPNGLFTTHLLAALAEPGLPAHEVFRRVRSRVSAASGGKQVPWVWESLVGDFVFKPGVRTGEATGDIEAAVWDAIKDSASAAVFEQFLRDYPSGRFRLAAQAKLDALGAGAARQDPGRRSRVSITTAGLPPDDLSSQFEQHAAPLRAAGIDITFGVPAAQAVDFYLLVSPVKRNITATDVQGVAMRSCQVSFDVTLKTPERVVLRNVFVDSGVAANDSAACSQAISKSVRNAVTAIVQAIRKG